MHARPGRGQAVACPEGRPGQDEDGELGSRGARVGHADFPRVALRASDREVAVGIDEGAGVAVQEGEGTIGDPPLGDAVEVERRAGARVRSAPR